MVSRRFGPLLRGASALVICSIATSLSAQMPADAKSNFKVIYSFTGGATGQSPNAPLFVDKHGVLFGTTEQGGDSSSDGTVFTVTPKGVQNVLYAFQGFENNNDGSQPQVGPTVDAKGNVYGTTQFGGTADCQCGIIYKVAAGGKETILYTFKTLAQGYVDEPSSPVTLDKKGDLYGTDAVSIYELTTGGTFKVLYGFCPNGDCSTGTTPSGRLLRDSSGNIYGTTQYNDSTGQSCGVVYKLVRKKITVLHPFNGPTDGCHPSGGVIADTAGNLYGLTATGGAHNFGTVYEIAADGSFQPLYSFQGTSASDGQYPAGELVRDGDGNLYGVTLQGGSQGDGTVFKVTPQGVETIVHAFKGTGDGSFPLGGLVSVAKRRSFLLYGTTSLGDDGYGNVFRITE